MPRRSARLVIDACVLSAASHGRPDESASRCADVLDAVRTMDALVFCAPDGLQEWLAHRSRYAALWLTALRASRRLKIVYGHENQSLRRCVHKALRSTNRRIAALKDVHLVEVALIESASIVSSDKEARGLFRSVGSRCTVLCDVIWMSPDEPTHDVLQWLRAGARHSDAEKLC